MEEDYYRNYSNLTRPLINAHRPFLAKIVIYFPLILLACPKFLVIYFPVIINAKKINKNKRKPQTRKFVTELNPLIYPENISLQCFLC